MRFSCNAGAAGALTAMIIKRLGFADKYWSLLFTINGGLTGMVWLPNPGLFPKIFSEWFLAKDRVNALYHCSHSVAVSLPSHQLRRHFHPHLTTSSFSHASV